MKKLILLLGITALVVITSTNAFAGGGKVRGENGNGEVNQVQVKDPPPFR